jgi:hypothetical protein
MPGCSAAEWRGSADLLLGEMPGCSAAGWGCSADLPPDGVARPNLPPDGVARPICRPVEMPGSSAAG